MATLCRIVVWDKISIPSPQKNRRFNSFRAENAVIGLSKFVARLVGALITYQMSSM